MKVTLQRAGGGHQRGWSRAPRPGQLSLSQPWHELSPKSTAGASTPTCVPALGAALARVVQPPLAPGVREVDQEHELDEDEEEGADHAEVKPDLRGGEKPAKNRAGETRGHSRALIPCRGAQESTGSSSPEVKVPSGM